MKNLFLLAGGRGREHEVSLSSHGTTSPILQEKGIHHESIIIEKNGDWMYEGKSLSEEEGLKLLQAKNALVYQHIHGTYGEDGELVSKLETSGVAYIGSGSESMKITIDKYKTEQLLERQFITTTFSRVVKSSNDISNISNSQINFPVIVKPKDEGSSFGLFKPKNMDELREVLENAGSQYGEMLVQDFVEGREFSCGVMEFNGKNIPLLPTEIILTKGEMFDYDAKYTVGGSQEITPADINHELTKKIQDIALKVHEVCGCKDISRTDMTMKENGEIVVLEINTVPGMTKTSFIPAQLKASGYSIEEFVKVMLEKYS